MTAQRTILLSGLVIAFFGFTIKTIKYRIRVCIGWFMDTRMRGRSQLWPARTSTVSLFIAPHQDDTTLGCGGLIAARIAAGESVHIIYITDGSASHPGHPESTPAMIATIRAGEARVASGILGVPGSHLSFLDAPDGRLPHLEPKVRADLVLRIQNLIERVSPSEVFITSRHDGSTEHVAASLLVRDALAGLKTPPPRLLEYIVWSRWNPLLLRSALRAHPYIYRHVVSESEAKMKRNAINAYRSQIEPLPPWPHAVLPNKFALIFRNREEFFFEF